MTDENFSVPSYYSRQEAAERLGCSTTSVKVFHHDDLLLTVNLGTVGLTVKDYLEKLREFRQTQGGPLYLTVAAFAQLPETTQYVRKEYNKYEERVGENSWLFDGEPYIYRKDLGSLLGRTLLKVTADLHHKGRVAYKVSRALGFVRHSALGPPEEPLVEGAYPLRYCSVPQAGKFLFISEATADRTIRKGLWPGLQCGVAKGADNKLIEGFIKGLERFERRAPLAERSERYGALKASSIAATALSLNQRINAHMEIIRGGPMIANGLLARSVGYTPYGLWQLVKRHGGGEMVDDKRMVHLDFVRQFRWLHNQLAGQPIA